MKGFLGFSLLEILAVLSIGILIGTLTLTGQKTFLTRAVRNGDSLKLLSALEFAHNEAIANQVPIIVCSTLNENTCANQWTPTIIVLQDKKVIFQCNLNDKEKLHLRLFPRGKNRLEFLPTGELHSENGTVWSCSPNATNPNWALVLNQSGRARLSKPDQHGQIIDEKGELLNC